MVHLSVFSKFLGGGKPDPYDYDTYSSDFLPTDMVWVIKGDELCLEIASKVEDWQVVFLDQDLGKIYLTLMLKEVEGVHS